MTNSSTLNTKSTSLYYVQPTNHTIKPRIFPSLPYTKENLNFVDKFDFQFSFSELTDTLNM